MAQDFNKRVQEGADRLHSASIHLLRRLRRLDAATGIGPARLSALSVLVYGGATTLGQLAAAEQVSAPTMSRLIAGMEAQGLVLRRSDPEDGRAIRLRASAKGKRVLAAARGERVALLAGLISKLSPAEQGQVASAAELLERLARSAPESDDRP